MWKYFIRPKSIISNSSIIFFLKIFYHCPVYFCIDQVINIDANILKTLHILLSSHKAMAHLDFYVNHNARNKSQSWYSKAVELVSTHIRLCVGDTPYPPFFWCNSPLVASHMLFLAIIYSKRLILHQDDIPLTQFALLRQEYFELSPFLQHGQMSHWNPHQVVMHILL